MSSRDAIKGKRSTNILLSDIKKEPDYLSTQPNVPYPRASFASSSREASHVPHVSAPASASTSVVVAGDSQYSTATNSTTANLSASLFESPSNLLQQLRTKSMPEMSSVLRLDPFVLLDRDDQAAAEVQKVCPNPQGYHVCLYCHRTFSSASLYANHINRPVARVIYRCHLCSTHLDTGPTPTVVSQQTSSPPSSLTISTSTTVASSSNPVSMMSASSTLPSPCNLLAPNLCALYVHMAQCHANEPVTAWRLVPSRLTVTAIPWLVSGAKVEGANGASRSTPIQPPLPPSLPPTTYVEGQELIDLGNDLDRRLTNLLRAGEFRFSSARVGGIAEEGTFLRAPDVRSMTSISTRFVPTPLQPTGLSVDGLPRSLASPISHLLFRLAEASIWHGYFFLAGWYPSFTGISIQETSLPLPCAASVKQIEQAYNALLRDSQTGARGCSREGGGRGVLRCLLCGEFCTNTGANLRTHLNGRVSGADVSLAKCALCALSVVHNRKDMVLCSIKAHLLFHLDIFLMCPQCGFTPPPDLTPSLAEICLRLHLRFVCFHFNLVKVLLCSRASCRERIFLTMESFVQHWFEVHTARKYACQLCGSLGHQRKIEVDAADDAVVRLNGLIYDFSDLASVCIHLQERHSLSATSAPTFSQVAYKCSECTFVSSVPVEFADHFSSAHCRLGEVSTITAAAGAAAPQSRQSPCEAQCFYRCFGDCSQFLHDIGELRTHMRTCSFAISTLKRAFGEQFLNSTQAASGSVSASAAVTGEGKGNPLCLCLYCDISRRKTDPFVSGNDEGEANSSLASRAFDDLRRLHAHEHIVHVTGGAAAVAVSGQVGCPWCGEKLTLMPTPAPASIITPSAAPSNHTEDLINHLRGHATANPYVAWQVERVRRFNESRGEVVICHCQTGWLDSPLALMAHASAFPTATNTFRGSRKRLLGDTSLLPFPSLFAAPTGNTATPIAVEDAKVGRKPTFTATTSGGDGGRGGGEGENAIFTVRPLYLPGGHPPLSREVYEHLRFGEHYDLDERLKAFNVALKTDDVEAAAKETFQCPLCLSHEASRWALTEHAFFSHWLRLCYVCCHYICEAGAMKSGEQSIWGHIFSCLSQRHAALLLRVNTNNGDVDDDPGWRRCRQSLYPQEEVKVTVPSSSLHHIDATTTAPVFEDGRSADPPSVGVATMETDDVLLGLRGVGALTSCNDHAVASGADPKQSPPSPSAPEPVVRKIPRLASVLIG